MLTKEHKSVLPANSILSYRIYTSGSIALFLATSSAPVSLRVNKDYNHTLVKHSYLGTASYPWLFLNATNSQLLTYDLTILNEGEEDTTVTVLFEEDDLLSWERLYQDIVLYDAFTF